MSIEVFNESGYDGVNEEALIDVAQFALMRMDIHPAADMTISIVDRGPPLPVAGFGRPDGRHEFSYG